MEGHEQALITSIRNETKQKEELEEAGYRSPTWALLHCSRSIVPRELKEKQRCLPLLSFSRRDEEICSSGEKRTNGNTMIRESLSKQEKESWLEEASMMHDWVVWCQSKKGEEEIRSFELCGKEIFFNYDGTKSKEEKNKKNGSKRKAHRGQNVQYRLWWKQGNIKMAMSKDHASHWVHKDLIVTTKQIQALLTAVRAPGGKDECQVRLTGIEREY